MTDAIKVLELRARDAIAVGPSAGKTEEVVAVFLAKAGKQVDQGLDAGLVCNGSYVTLASTKQATAK